MTAAPPSQTSSLDFDAIIIGAGLSGMTYFPSLQHAAKILSGPPAVPSPGQLTASTIIDKVAQRPSGKTSKC